MLYDPIFKTRILYKQKSRATIGSKQIGSNLEMWQESCNHFKTALML